MRMTSVLLMVLLSPLTLTTQGQGGLEDIKASVVRITSKAPEGQARTGTGFIVRVDGEIIYIATASHVVAGDQKPQVAFYHDRLRPVAAEIGELESGDTGLGYVIVRDQAIARKVKPLRWNTGRLRGGEVITTIGFGLGAGPWGVVTGTVASVSGADIRIDGRIEEGNSGGPILMNGNVVGLVTTTGTFGVGKSAIVVQTTLRGWDVDIRTRKYASLVGEWAGSPYCTLVVRVDDGEKVQGSCDTAAVQHLFDGVYQSDDGVRLTLTRIDPDKCKTTAAGDIKIENDDTIVVSQAGWDGCQVKTGSATTLLKRSTSR